MTKREAKRVACRSAYNLLNTSHNNEFLIEQEDEKDGMRLESAWEELLDELYRRGWGRKEKGA